PTGSQSQLEARGRRDQAQRRDPRSGQEVCIPSRSGLRIARSSGDPDSADGAQGKCVRRALDWELPSRMPRLDTGRQPAPAGGHRRVSPALQRRAPAPEPQPTTARLPQRSYAGGRWSDRAANPPRRLAQRLSPIAGCRVTSFSNPTPDAAMRDSLPTICLLALRSILVRHTASEAGPIGVGQGVDEGGTVGYRTRTE